VSNNSISTLRDHLFDTLKQLRDKETPMDIDRAKAVCAVSEQIIDSARVENEFVKLTGAAGSGFIPAEGPALPPPAAADGTPAGNGILGIRRHQLKG